MSRSRALLSRLGRSDGHPYARACEGDSESVVRRVPPGFRIITPVGMEKVDAQPALVLARITSRDCHTQFFAVAVPRFLASGPPLDSVELPVTGELLRGSLLERTVRHTKGCPKCARGENFPCRQLPSSSGTTPVVRASLPSRASNSAPCAIKIVSARLERGTQRSEGEGRGQRRNGTRRHT